MPLNLSADFFELFDLPVGFDLPDDELASRFRVMQRQLHPDRYAARPDAERRWSVQAASHVNDGYHTLRHPLSRAAYLLKLNGLSVDEETDTRMDPGFLMEQMELREALEAVPSAAEPVTALQNIEQQLTEASAQRHAAFHKASTEGDWAEGRSVIRQWQFLDKLRRECREMEARLDG